MGNQLCNTNCFCAKNDSDEGGSGVHFAHKVYDSPGKVPLRIIKRDQSEISPQSF